MTPEQAKKARIALSEIAADAQRDATEFDGRPFTGRTVGEYFGNHGASIAALANIMALLLPTLPKEEPMPENDRTRILTLLAEIDDEAFSWVAVALVQRIWPDGLGGFRDRKGIEAVRQEARRYCGMEDANAD